MFGFGLPLWVRGNVPARNHKGLVTFDRKHKKDSYYWYKSNWNSDPMVYISDRRVINRKKSITDIHVYCNTKNLKLFVNGKRHKLFEKGKTDVHYIFKNIELNKGENKIFVSAGNKETLYDKIMWILK
jgi:beta-galactosidase